MIFDSGEFDVDGFDDTPIGWTLDTILQLTQTATFELDAHIMKVQTVPFSLDLRIGSPHWNFALDTILVLQRDNPAFQESIINAMMWSYGRAIEKLSESVDLMGASLKLPDAPVEDLDLYWSKMLGIKRRSGEADETFRMRLATRLSILSSSGTKAEIEAIINRILEIPNATQIETYWPAQINVNWASTAAARQAKANYDAIKEALDLSTLAGTRWQTWFPFQDWQMDINLLGPKPVSFRTDINLMGSRSWPYLMGLDLSQVNTKDWSLGAYVEHQGEAGWRTDMRVIARNTEDFVLDGIIQKLNSKDWQMDGILEAGKTKDQSMDMIAEASKIKVYNLDMLAEKGKRGFFMLDAELVAA